MTPSLYLAYPAESRRTHQCARALIVSAVIAAATSSIAEAAPSAGVSQTDAMPYPLAHTAAPLNPRGKPLFRPRPDGRPLGHHWISLNNKIGFWVGMRMEPAHAREENGLEVYTFKDIEGIDADGYPIGGVPVDPVNNPGDTVNITAIYQLLENNNPKGKVIAQKDLGRIGQGRLDVPDLGYFVTEFIPNPAGRYAIVLGGELNGVKVQERVVCAYETEEVHTFSCIETRVPSVF